jgi:hypothetical protein
MPFSRPTNHGATRQYPFPCAAAASANVKPEIKNSIRRVAMLRIVAPCA